MNIVYIVQRWPSVSESFILNEIVELDSRGHNVAVFAFRKESVETKHREIQELDIPIGYASTARPTATEITTALPELLSAAGTEARNFYRAPTFALAGLRWGHDCREFIEALPWLPDVLHCHFVEGVMIGAQYAAARLDLPCTVTAHAYDIFSPPNEFVRDRLLERFNAIITVSQYHQEWIQEKINPNTPIYVIGANIDTDKFSPQGECEGPSTLLTVGRLVEKKGHDIALKSVQSLIENGYDIEYRIVGDGELRDEIESLVEKLGITDQVVFKGIVSDGQLLQQYDHAGIFLQPSRVTESGNRDGIPITIKEAMAMETVPVTTDIAGISELVTDGQSGFVVPPEDPVRITDKIEKLLNDKKLWMQMKSKARAHAIERASITHSCDELEYVFSSIC